MTSTLVKETRAFTAPPAIVPLTSVPATSNPSAASSGVTSRANAMVCHLDDITVRTCVVACCPALNPRQFPA